MIYRVLLEDTALGECVMYRVLLGYCFRRGCVVQVVAGGH